MEENGREDKRREEMTTDGKHVQTGGRAGRDKDNQDRKKRFIVRGGDRKKKYSHAKEKTEENRRKQERLRQEQKRREEWRADQQERK